MPGAEYLNQLALARIVSPASPSRCGLHTSENIMIIAVAVIIPHPISSLSRFLLPPTSSVLAAMPRHPRQQCRTTDYELSSLRSSKRHSFVSFLHCTSRFFIFAFVKSNPAGLIARTNMDEHLESLSVSRDALAFIFSFDHSIYEMDLARY